ncbi:coiled-coil domain-containing protein [Helicobacter pylori]|uniref:coiled-coil domain-containing protein n=1 Tax=Helicobacter pylori TaxID=210 RepID=UPI00165B5EA4|nr:OmpH family outer membrane protein [Helicobacter pylori]
MDLKGLEDALNNGDFKEQVTSSLEGIYQISKVLNQLDLLKNFSDHDLEIVGKIQTIKNALERYETSGQELKSKIDALVNSLEARKQELEAQLNMELESARSSEIQKLNEAGSELKNNLAQELEQLKASAQSLIKPQIQGLTKFLGVYVYGRQTLFENESNDFAELFEFSSIHLQARKIYIVQFSMPFELSTNGIYSESMGEILLGLKTNGSVYPIVNSFYQLKTANLFNKKIINTYKTNCVFETPSEQADYKIAVFARKHKGLWVNVNYTPNIQGFEMSFLNNAVFKNSTTKKIPTAYSNDWVFYKHSQALVYEIIQ